MAANSPRLEALRRRLRPATAGDAGYGRRYRAKPLPAGLTTEQLAQRVSGTSWYHAIDLGHGIVTPGSKPLEVIDREWELFALGDLTGRSLLDIGAADGAYAFRAEQAGAAPVAALDHYVWSVDADAYGRLYQDFVAAGQVPPAPHESELWDPQRLPGRWRFDLVRQVLGSRVAVLVTDFGTCDLGRLGAWDVVLYLGVLYHMEDPVGALRRVAAVTRGQAIVETEAAVVPGHPEPLWRFFPGGELNHDRTNWWVPNLAALTGALGAVGFADVEVLAGEPPGAAQTAGGSIHYRAIVRAIK